MNIDHGPRSHPHEIDQLNNRPPQLQRQHQRNESSDNASRRLLIFQEARNPSNMSEIVYLPVNKLGLPICGSGPELPSILELPLRILRAFTEIFNQPKYKGWYVSRPASLLLYHHRCIYIYIYMDDS